MVSSCTVVTSAHAFVTFNKNKVVKFEPFEFCLDLHGDIREAKVIKVVDYRFPKEYEEICRKIEQSNSRDEKYRLFMESVKYDFALLKLEKNVQLSSFPTLCPDSEDANVTVCGFPSDVEGGLKQYSHSGRVKVDPKSGKGVYDDIDTRKGVSGSPVYYTADGECFVVGLHKGHDPRERQNVCTLLTTEAVLTLQKWMGEMSLTLKTRGGSPIVPVPSDRPASRPASSRIVSYSHRPASSSSKPVPPPPKELPPQLKV